MHLLRKYRFPVAARVRGEDGVMTSSKGSSSILLSEEFLTKPVAELSVQEIIKVITVVNEPLHHKLGSISKELGCKVKRVK